MPLLWSSDRPDSGRRLSISDASGKLLITVDLKTRRSNLLSGVLAFLCAALVESGRPALGRCPCSSGRVQRTGLSSLELHLLAEVPISASIHSSPVLSS